MSLPDGKNKKGLGAAAATAPYPIGIGLEAQATLGNVCLVNLPGGQASAVRESLAGVRCRIHEHRDSSNALAEVLAGSVSLAVLHESGALEFCRAVRSSQAHELMPLLVVGDSYNAAAEVALLEAGADAYLAGAVSGPVLRARVQSCLRRKALTDAMDETETVLFTLAHSVEERDPALGQHCERLSFMAAATGIALGLDTVEIVSLQRGGFLHDIGKIAIPDSVLFKPGPLTAEEWDIMQSHPERGERICRPVRSLTAVLPMIRSHHEKWDGSGYPDKLRGEKIPVLARILQLADIYDALTTARPYKRAFTSEQAVQTMKEEVAKGWRDPELSRVFFHLVPFFEHRDRVPLSQLSLGALAASVGRFRHSGPGSELRNENDPGRTISGL